MDTKNWALMTRKVRPLAESSDIITLDKINNKYGLFDLAICQFAREYGHVRTTSDGVYFRIPVYVSGTPCNPELTEMLTRAQPFNTTPVESDIGFWKNLYRRK